jgi:SAM-dependent methyltransferase
VTDLDPRSLERIIPEALEAEGATGRETLRLHVERYRFAAGQVAGGVVLDLACGVGYGSAILGGAAAVRRVVAADRSVAALRHARASHAHPAVSPVCGDGGAWCRPASFDAVVSLETMEHVEDPRRLFGELVAALRPGGVLVVSVPTTPSVDANPHHRTDFTERSLFEIGRGCGLSVTAELRQVQRFSPFAVLLRRERRTEDLRRGLAGWYLRHPGAAARRLASLLRFGFTNRYLTVAWRLTAGAR